MPDRNRSAHGAPARGRFGYRSGRRVWLRKAWPILIKLLAVAILLTLVGMEAGVIPMQGEICREAADKTHEYCTPHNIAYVVLHWISHTLNYYGGLITAIATVFLAFFTYTLWATGERQARLIIDGRRTSHRQFLLIALQTDLLEKQKEISRIQFLTSHRPQMKIRQLVFDIGSPAGKLNYSYMIVNTGSNDGVVTEMNQTIVYQEGKRLTGPLTNEPDTMRRVSISLAPGEFEYVYFSDDVPADEFHRQVLANAIPVSIFGFVTYTDVLGKIRRTGFFRNYNVRSRRFEAMDDPEYEYTD
jgi:hypothetical protein